MKTMGRDRGGSGLSLRDGIGLLAGAVWLMGLIVGVPCAASAQMLSVEETETLVRAVYFEGMPEDQAAAIGPEGCERLLEMLADPGESASHGQILMAIGICGPPGGFEAIRAWADAPREGEIDRNTFRAWQALPFAFGHLARHDRRALARLEAGLSETEAPAWTFRQQRGARLVSQSRRAAATGLALSGMPEALPALERASGDATDQSFREHLDAAREMHRRVSLERARSGDDPSARNGLGGTQGERR